MVLKSIVFFFLCVYSFIFNERHVHVRYMLSPVRLSSVCLSVTLARTTQAVEIFGNIYMALGTLAIC